MQIKSITAVGRRDQHNGFTDLCYFNNQLFCCYREATNHVSRDGNIRILTLDLSGNVVAENQINWWQCDLRDPKLTITPDNQLLLIAYARTQSESKPVCWSSADGTSWSSPRFFGDAYWWLWRIRWHQNQAYGLAYNRSAQAIHLYQGHPKRRFYCFEKNVLSKEKQGLGYPNESDMMFDSLGTCYALVRRDADTCTAQLGIASAPFKKWTWHDLHQYIGGPVMLPLDDNYCLVAGRQWEYDQISTAIWTLNLKDKSLTHLITLPSAGDCSYPGLVKVNDTLYVSYYSSHEGKTNVYLAQLAL
ncbi:hypothetical protein OE749_12295 [Aestuariibacter sp. AA17]|uniref:Exo-alpha-sialidase n=1 Tax=Fluctibacter corallii TaxID=2984329 RepID=A0ABT3A9X0_9ALTE|nr:hypothetical protein [Aestuariibacter sp. AA17]MCV2885476.1 hypothetical protein [Aestuariibacter sp. AA17]